VVKKKKESLIINASKYMFDTKYQIVAGIILATIVLLYSCTRPLVPNRTDPMRGTDDNSGYYMTN